MPFNFSGGETSLSESLNISGGDVSVENDFDEDLRRTTAEVSPINFKKLTISYMNSEAMNFGYPNIFAAMSLKNSSIPELAAEGASWTEFFDAGMSYVDYEIKLGGYTAFSDDIYQIKQDSLSPKLSFTPSLTYPSLAV